MREGWRTVALSEVCTKVQDGAHRSPQTLYSEPGEGRFLYLTSKNIRTGYMKLNSVQYCDSEFHQEIYRRCNPELGDILLTKDGANTGNVAINELDAPFSLLSSVCLLKPDQTKVSSGFLSYYLQSKEGFEQITGQMTGAAIKRIILKTIKSSRMPLPPLYEQQRIVAILDEAFAGIATAVANTEKNLANARELFESYLDSAFSQQAERCRSIELGKVCRLINGRAYKKSELLNSGPYPVLRVGNFFTNQSWYYSDLELDEDKYCDYGDLLYAWSASFGPRIWEGSKVIFHYHIWKVDFDLEEVDKRFLYYWFDWDKKKIKKEQGAGTTMIHVTKGSMENRKLSLPSIPDQTRIVSLLDDLSVELRRLEGIYKRKLTALTEFRQSLLQKAFSGELPATPQDEIENALA